MKKKTFNWHGKTYFLLGKDKSGEMYYLEKEHFDCGWYWGFGYVETFTNKTNPECSRDIESHQHLNGLIFDGPENCYDQFKKLFVETPLSDKELWSFLELAKTIYLLKDYQELTYSGNVNISGNVCHDLLKSEEDYKKTDDKLKALFVELNKLLEA